jgi:hypothetical protein
LVGGAPRLLGSHGGLAGKAYRRAYDTLASEFPLTTPFLRYEAGRVAALRVEFESAMVALADARRKRKEGRGRRPNTKLIEQLARRAGLADNSYAQALGRLQEMVARHRNGHGHDLASIVAQAHQQVKANGS